MSTENDEPLGLPSVHNERTQDGTSIQAGIVRDGMHLHLITTQPERRHPDEDCPVPAEGLLGATALLADLAGIAYLVVDNWLGGAVLGGVGALLSLLLLSHNQHQCALLMRWAGLSSAVIGVLVTAAALPPLLAPPVKSHSWAAPTVLEPRAPAAGPVPEQLR